MSTPVLYKANETNFNTLGLGALPDSMVSVVFEELNGQYYLELKYPTAGPMFKELKNDRLIKADASNNLKQQRFKIVRITKPSKGVVTVYAEHISYHTQEMQLKPKVSFIGNASTALDTWKNNIVDEHEFTVYSDIAFSSKGEWSIENVESARKALGGVEGSLLDVYGGEYRFDNYHIGLYAARGNDNGAMIAYGKNLTELEQEEEIADTYTSVYPFSIVTDEGSDIPRMITLPEYYVDSQYVGNFARRKILLVNFSEDKIDTEAQLRIRAQQYITSNKIGVPKVNLKVQFVDLAKTLDYKHLKLIEEINLGDWVNVYFDKLGVRSRAKVIKTAWNVLLDRYDEIELGDSRASLSQAIGNTVDGKLEPVNNKINVVQISADGKTKTYRGPDEPAGGNLGDLWYKPIGDGQTEMYQHDGSFWRFVMSTAKLDQVAEDVANAVAEIENVAQAANDAVAKAEQAVADVGFLKPDVATAKTNAATALANANTAVSNAALSLTNSNTAISNAATAVTNANTAISNAQTALNRVGSVEEVNESLQTSFDALTQTVTLKADKSIVDGLKNTVTTQGTSITANATAIGLKADKTTVNTLTQTVTKNTADIEINSEGLALKAEKSIVDAINATVGTHTTQIKATSDGLALKADSSTVNTIKGTVDTHTTQIKATSDGLLLKADSSLVNTINGTVNTHTTQIKATSDGLALKADSSLVNTIKGTVDSHTTQISANSTAITARMTSTQVETLLTGKKYVNETTLNATSSGLTAQITQVSNDLSNLEIGGRNYFTKAHTFQQTTVNGSFLPRDSSTPNGFRVTGNSTATGQVRLNNVITENGWWTVSFDLKGSQSTPVGMTVDICDAGGTRLNSNNTNTYTRVSVSVKVTNYSSAVYHFVDFGSISYAYIWVDNIKVEKGQKATDWSPAPEDMATLEKVVTIEANIDGINTLVASKASQTQVTQLAGQISTKVESSTYTSKMTQLDSAINLRVLATDVTAAILADKTIKDTRATNELPSWYNTNYPKQTIEEFKQRTTMGVPGSATYGKLETKVIWNSTSGGAITQIFSSSDGVFQRVSNAGYTAWLAWDKIIEATELLSQINVQAGKILIQTGKLYLDAATVTFSGSAFIPSAAITTLDAGKITAGTLNAANVNIINMNASNISTGTLSGITITSPFNYVYTGTTRNVGTTTISNGDISMRGTFTNSFGSTFLKLNADSLYAENLTSSGAVRSLFKLNGDGITVVKDGETAYYRQDGVYFESGGNASIKYSSGNARIEIGSYNGVGLGVNSSGQYWNRLTVGGGDGQLAPFVDIWVDLTIRSTTNFSGQTLKNAAHIGGVKDILFADTSNRIVQGSDNILNIMSPVAISLGYTNGTTTSDSLTINNAGTTFKKAVQFNGNAINGANNINGAQTILFHNTSNRIVQGSDGFLNILSPVQLSLGWTNGSSTFTTMIITQNQIVANKVLNMNGNLISNTSDRRLKKKIKKTKVDALSLYREYKFVEYEWKDKDRAKGTQFGLIAQDSPFISFQDKKGLWHIDTTKQIMLNSLGVKELDISVQKVENDIVKLKKQIKKLEMKLK